MILAEFVGPHGIAANYGWFHVYSFTMYMGITISVLASWYKLHKHNVPTESLIWSTVFIIPAALFGASFFGKEDPLNPLPFFDKFAFWNPGLSIHGGVLLGVIVGLIFFAFASRKYQISLWTYADCIIPNILLGQVIGRWGNFFNHELLGSVVGTSTSLNASGIPILEWLPAFIRDNCFSLVGGTPETDINGLYVFRAPIFLYESLGDLGLWFVITFFIPLFFKSISKKPWKKEKTKYHLIPLASFKNNKAGFFPRTGQSIINFTKFIIQNHKLKNKFWDEAYYDYKVPETIMTKLNKQYNHDRVGGYFNELKAYTNRSKMLYSSHNEHKYAIMRTGVQTGFYFFGWNLIRFALEIQREDRDLFLVNQRTLDYIVLIGIAMIGLVISSYSQFIAPRYFRKPKILYEKDY